MSTRDVLFALVSLIPFFPGRTIKILVASDHPFKYSELLFVLLIHPGRGLNFLISHNISQKNVELIISDAIFENFLYEHQTKEKSMSLDQTDRDVVKYNANESLLDGLDLILRGSGTCLKRFLEESDEL